MARHATRSCAPAWIWPSGLFYSAVALDAGAAAPGSGGPLLSSSRWRSGGSGRFARMWWARAVGGMRRCWPSWAAWVAGRLRVVEAPAPLALGGMKGLGWVGAMCGLPSGQI